MAYLYSCRQRQFALAIFTALAAICIILAAAPAQAATPAQIKERGTLVVGVIPDYPPYGTIDDDGNPIGFGVDVSKLLAESLGVKLKLVPTASSNRIPYLLTGKVDMIIAVLGITPARVKRVLYSIPLSTLTIALIAPKSLKINKPADLDGVTVSVVRGGSELQALRKIAPKGVIYKKYASDSASIQAIVSGQAQAIGASSVVLARVTKRFPDLQLEQKFILNQQANGIALRKEDTELQQYCNTFIKKISKSGELAKIWKKWFGYPMPKLPPMPEFAKN